MAGIGVLLCQEFDCCLCLVTPFTSFPTPVTHWRREVQATDWQGNNNLATIYMKRLILWLRACGPHWPHCVTSNGAEQEKGLLCNSETLL
ncbi:hypothetical protein MHYP_G00224870 [Metynnis hypsauchen]